MNITNLNKLSIKYNIISGVFKTFSSSFDVVLEVVAKIENPDGPNPSLQADSYMDKLIFRACDILDMEAMDVDMDYATRDTFQTDAAISARLNGKYNVSTSYLSINNNNKITISSTFYRSPQKYLV